MGYLSGEREARAKNDPTYATWDVENSMVMAWLVNSMDEDIGGNYMCYATAKELWDKVNQMYSDLSNDAQVYEIEQLLGETLKGFWQNLDMFNDYEWKCSDDCNHYKKLVESSRIFKFLAGLNLDLDKVRGRIIGRKPLPAIVEVFFFYMFEGKKATEG